MRPKTRDIWHDSQATDSKALIDYSAGRSSPPWDPHRFPRRIQQVFALIHQLVNFCDQSAGIRASVDRSRQFQTCCCCFYQSVVVASTPTALPGYLCSPLIENKALQVSNAVVEFGSVGCQP